MDNSIYITFHANGFEMKDSQDHQLLLSGRLNNGLYQITTTPANRQMALHTRSNSSHLWHARLGHPNNRVLQTVAVHLPDSITSSHISLCKSCNTAKSHRISFNKSCSVTSSPFDLIHSDVWGPAPVSSSLGFRYYVIFIDDYSRHSWIYFMHCKNETFSKFKLLCKLIQNQFGKTPKSIQTDGGGEFINNNFISFLQEQGITRRTSCPHTPEQNGIAERKHRHILELTRTLLHASNAPQSFWCEAVSTAIHLINRLPSKHTGDKSPYQIIYNKIPAYNHLRVFGCLCYPWLQPYTDNKFTPRSTDCVFLGYSNTYKGYVCYNLTTKKMHISRHVVFHEDVFPFNTQAVSSSASTSQQTSPNLPLILVPASTITHSKNLSTESAPIIPHNNCDSSIPSLPGSSTQHTQFSEPSPPRPRSDKSNHPMQTRSKSGISKPNPIYSLNTTHPQDSTPVSYNQAAKHAHWRIAMAEEIKALQQQQTWSLVSPPSNKTILGCKWTFKTKLLPSGKVHRYKARLVALGNHQRFGENYTETFSPVAKMPTIRFLLTVALNRKWAILQLDVSNAFLHGDLLEEIYMKQPKGFIDPNQPTPVCKLHKSLYGLKQAPRLWFQKLTDFLLARGFRFSRSDTSLLLLLKNNVQIYFLIYVDDIILTGSDPNAIKSLLADLHSTFALKQLGQINLFLGIQVTHTSHGLFLTQAHYAAKLLKTAGMTDCKSSPTPMASASK
ncbi:hypothetical protein KFK09_027830 [Dendrobium nobile]|uniref:Integrase catalytic domain-containing protein n=1 Tax=Dendrobium nobile TaxID=94219 RepID=A0A8T3A1H5_DENNO|nr:hypothetical protein KFK09_027830 [Dendrobium nobile]